MKKVFLIVLLINWLYGANITEKDCLIIVKDDLYAAINTDLLKKYQKASKQQQKAFYDKSVKFEAIWIDSLTSTFLNRGDIVCVDKIKKSNQEDKFYKVLLQNKTTSKYWIIADSNNYELIEK